MKLPTSPRYFFSLDPGIVVNSLDPEVHCPYPVLVFEAVGVGVYVDRPPNEHHHHDAASGWHLQQIMCGVTLCPDTNSSKRSPFVNIGG